jgi:hypothetical protein
MYEAKTKVTDAAVADFIAAVEDPVKRDEALRLDALFRRVTGFTPRMWGPSIIGYGRYHYKYATGHEGDAAATGFSPRKAEHSLYIMPGYTDYGEILDRLGKHRLGKACLYIKSIDKIDLGALEDLIRTGLTDLGKLYPVFPD